VRLITPFRVRLAGGEQAEGRATPLDMVQAERKYGGISEVHHMESTFFMAWSALRRDGAEVGDFDAFLSRLEDYEEVVEPGEAA
jgi:hypothetical protein